MVQLTESIQYRQQMNQIMQTSIVNRTLGEEGRIPWGLVPPL